MVQRNTILKIKKKKNSLCNRVQFTVISSFQCYKIRGDNLEEKALKFSSFLLSIFPSALQYIYAKFTNLQIIVHFIFMGIHAIMHAYAQNYIFLQVIKMFGYTHDI